jgi:hypothetical protein
MQKVDRRVCLCVCVVCVELCLIVHVPESARCVHLFERKMQVWLHTCVAHAHKPVAFFWFAEKHEMVASVMATYNTCTHVYAQYIRVA